MIKRIIAILIGFFVLYACEDDETSFGITMPKEGLRFEKAPGGAIMYYKLPDDDNIMSIRIRYQDAFGNEIVRSGSYVSDSISLIGFNEARENVEGFVSLCNRGGDESEPVRVTFSTSDSGPVAFFDSVRVTPDWEGFSVKYNMPVSASGLAHIFYVGTNPLTQQPDTILMKSISLKKGEEKLKFTLQQKAQAHTVVIRTEDFRGYIVKQQVWKDVAAYERIQVPGDKLELETNVSVFEDEQAKLGKKYLFDGNVKGVYGISLLEHNTFLAGPRALNKDFILKLPEKKTLATFRLYGMLYFTDLPKREESVTYGEIWSFSYISKLPCELTCYGRVDNGEWKEIGKFKQSEEVNGNTDPSAAWGIRCVYVATHRLSSLDAFNRADPAYLELEFPIDGEQYNQLKFVVNKTFKDWRGGDNNFRQYLSFHELEVYVKKD